MDVIATIAAYALAAIVILVAAFCYYLNNNFDYWKKRGVPFPQPEPFFGNMKEITLLRKSMAEVMADIYNQFEGHRFVGMFNSRTPTLLLRDLDLIKAVLVKDFNSFQHRGSVVDEKNDPLSAHLFALGGQKWRLLRTKMTPTFTSGKMKLMFHLMEECSSQLLTYLETSAEKQDTVEVRETLAKFTTDVIGTCAFGLQLNAMGDGESEFRQMGKKVFDPSPSNDVKRFLNFLLPELAKLIRIRNFNEEITTFFTRVVKETVVFREKNNVKRNDFLQLLIQMRSGKIDQEYDPLINNSLLKSRSSQNGSSEKNGKVTPNGYASQNGHAQNGHVKNGYSSMNGNSFQNGPIKNGRANIKSEEDIELTDDLLAAQAFVFFLAGFETSSTAMSFALHELAVNPEIQTRAQEEVDAVLKRHGGKITYDAVQEMEYLDNILSEALRKYPPGHLLVRECTRPYAVPGSSLVLERGVRVIVPVYALHHDPKYYPEPQRFDPERFNEENKATRPACTYMPFGEGPRLCIGMRFGLLQSKVGLAALLSRYEFHVSERTSVPIAIEPRTIVTTAKGGIWLRVKPRV